MVKVKSSTGGAVDIQIIGVAEALKYIRQKGMEVRDGADSGAFQAANFVQQEVQEDIIGNRPGAIRSVDTGRFANSIRTDKIQKSVYQVFPENSTYPNGGTVAEVARILEHGTTTQQPRRHFNRTKDRTKEAVRKIVEKEIDLAIKGKLGQFKAGLRLLK